MQCLIHVLPPIQDICSCLWIKFNRAALYIIASSYHRFSPWLRGPLKAGGAALNDDEYKLTQSNGGVIGMGCAGLDWGALRLSAYGGDYAIMAAHLAHELPCGGFLHCNIPVSPKQKPMTI